MVYRFIYIVGWMIQNKPHKKKKSIVKMHRSSILVFYLFENFFFNFFSREK